MTSASFALSYVLLWLTVLALTFAVVALLRHVGVLHARLHPMGAHFAGEGPELDAPAPQAGLWDYSNPLTLVVFTSPGCELCAQLRPSLRAIERQYSDVAVNEIKYGEATAPTFRVFNISNTPYAVAVDASRIVRGSGVVNTLDQLEELLAEAKLRARYAQD